MKPMLGLALLAIGAGLSQPTAAADARTPFAGFVVHPRGGVGPSFEFSAAPASSDAPVVISVVGRKTEPADREFRTSLQKRWLSEYVAAGRNLRLREQSMCDYRPGGGRCDRYEFEPGGEENAYYFALDNWP
ncbi:hypothetical protein [Lysobacter enzymogenes]|uniref:hypothetical protein n=1 Tax=Lysobacter enzymogenes TaxID=69 RepID=UPI001A9702AE|nr:hypothetical protein [Lysobacter enzymogenes]QQP95357.1 hypothetical protein JHW38_19260 [Lysobacter enzymogenes]